MKCHFLPPPIIDVEASGFGSSSYPIEVGLVLQDGSSFCALIAPEPDWQYWDDSAEKIHGVARSALLENGCPAAAVAREINTWLHGMTVYCDSWYHDFTWLSRLYEAAGSAPSFILEDIRSLLDQGEADIWHETRLVVQEELQLSRHRASNDARVLQATLMRVKLKPLPREG